MPWVKGQSGNPSGRRAGFRGVAARIARETEDCDELIQYALERFRDEDATRAERWEALQWLSDRSLGKPLVMTQLDAELRHLRDDAAIDLGLLTPAVMSAIRTALNPGPASAIPDAKSSDPELVEAELVE